MKLLMIGKNGLFWINRISFRFILTGPDAIYIAFLWLRFTFKLSGILNSIKNGWNKAWIVIGENPFLTALVTAFLILFCFASIFCLIFLIVYLVEN